MSDLSLVWHEYERNSQLSNQILADVVMLKRTQFGLSGSDKIELTELEASRLRLADFVEVVARDLNPDLDSDDADVLGSLQTSDETAMPSASGALLERLRHNNVGTMARYLGELDELAAELQSAQPLSAAQWELLEELTSHVHQEASRLFRRLWRK